MNMFESLRARAPSPGLSSQPSQPRSAFASRAAEEATPRQQPTIPALRLTTATPLAPSTGDDSILSIASTSTTPSDGSLAPPLLPSKKGGSKRVLVPKKPLQPSNQPTSSAISSSTISASRPAAKSLRRPLNDENSYQPPSDWNVVPPPPPPRTVGNPHQFASARRIAPVAAPIPTQLRSKPEPVAILPVKTQDGSSSTNNDRARHSSIGASSVRTTTASVRSNGTIRTQKENTLRVYTDEPNSQDTPILVKKKKSRLALDLGWALGDKTNGQTKDKDVNTPVSTTSTRAATPTLKEKGSISRLGSILRSKSSTLRLSTGSSPDKENVDAKDKEKWKWSIGLSRGRKENTIKEVFGGRRPKSPEPAPPAIRNLSSFVSSAGPVEYEYRTPSLEDHPPNLAPPPPPVEKDPIPSIPPTIRSVSAPLTSITTLSDTLPRPVSVRIPSGSSAKHHHRTLSANAVSDTLSRPVSVRIPSGPSAKHHYRTFSADAAAILAPIESPVAMTRYEPDPDQTPVRRPASPTVLVRRGDDSPVSPTADTPKYNSDSLAIRAMRSVRSMARLFLSPEDEEKEKESKLKKRHSRMTLKGIGIEVFGNHERRPSNSSQESWVIGAPSLTEASPSTAVKSTKAPVSGPVVDKPIVSASMRERMSTSIRPPSSEVEAPPRASVETFGTMRMRKGRRSGSTRRTLSTASNFTAVSSGTSESSDSGYGAMPGSRNASYRISSTGSGGRLSLFSALSSKSSQGNLKAKPADSLTEKTAKKRGSLANLFDLAASMASSGSSRSRRSTRVSKGSVESAGSRNSSGSDATSMTTHDAHTTARDRLEERIRTYQTLHTIPASPAPIQEEEDELSPPDLDTITNPQITRPSIPSFQPRTLTRNATVSYGPSGSKGKQADVTPQRMIGPKRRPASDHLLSSWAAERQHGVVSDGDGDVAILMVNAATSELGDLINHLDLAGTPDDATPVKTATPRRARAFTTGDSPDWSPLKGSNIFTAHLPPLMPTAPLSTAKSTFGRRLVRPELPIEQSPTEHITSSRRSSGTVGTLDDSDSIFDSPLKNRGRKQSGGSLLTNFGKASTGTMLSFQGRSIGKGSTGTMLSAFGPSKGSSNVGNTTGDVSLSAFGHVSLDGSDVEEDEAEAVDTDIPEELQEILLSHPEDYSLRSTEANGFCDLSIPGSTSALMASTHIESLLRRPSQTGNKSSVTSIPPTSVPAIPLPADPSVSKMSSSSSLSATHLMDETKAASTIPRSSASNPSAASLNRLSTSALHDHITSLDTLDEEDSLSASDEDITDHTGRSSFDFTKELNRLNEGGSRRSFVEQLANTFQGPSQPAGYRAPQEMPPLPSLDFLRQITHQDKMDVNSQRQSSSDDLPLAAHPDSTMYAIANLDLSLVLSTDESKKSGGPTKPVGRKVDHVRASSLSESLDASMAALTSLNLSVTNPSKPRPHSTSIESDVSKRHIRIAQARAYRRFQNMRERTLSAATTASFGSVVKPGVSDPFNYGRPSSYMEASGDESSGEGAERRQNHTVTSIPSISSYGAVLNSGVQNPFGYDLTMDFESRTGFLSQSVEMTRGANPRYSIDSDRSSFYFDSNKYAMRGQRDEDSIVSARSRSNRPLSFRQRARPDSIMSTSSLAWGHGSQGMQGGHTAWTRDQHDPARDSILSEFSFRRLSRPGLGDKMFESGPLYSIAGSPAQSSPPFMEFGHDEDDGRVLRRSVDSADSRSVRFSVDSIFDKTGSNTSSISSPSVFGYDDSGISASDGLFAPGVKARFRPLSMFSIASECDSSRDDDTMISMLGGDHTKVPRGSLGSAVNSSPCVRVEKKRRAFWRLRKDDSNEASQLSMSSADNSQEQSDNVGNSSLGLPSFEESDKSRATEASVSTQEHSHIFDRPFSALVNPSWVDLNAIAHQSGSRSSRAGQPPTPPLSYASSADGSQSSIDVEKLKMLLESSAPPSFNPDRLRPTGKGHRRRSHMSEMSRISVIESIAEEVTSESGSPRAPKFEHPPEPSIVVWDTHSRRNSWRESVDWESEFGVMLRQYYSLQTEAHETVQESQNLWLDTDFSRFALATFNPPRNPAGIQALLEHSQKTFIPLPLELCVRQPRSRANSRPSPYPRGPAKTISGQPFRRHGRTPSVESAINCISPFSNPLSSSTTEPTVSPTLATLAPLSAFSVNFQSAAESLPQENLQPIPSLCSAIESDAKRNVLGRRVGKPTDKTNANGWAFGKKSLEVLANKSANKSQIVANSSATAKENREREAQGTLTRNTTLRISRARPPRRPTAASVLAPNTLRV